MIFERDKLQSAVGAFAAKGVFIGTSSWKYPGWFGRIYECDRYVWRGKFSNVRFERNCLAEYAQAFKTVSVDAAYYQFPRREWIEEMVSQAPTDFQFTLKVTDEITINKFPNLPRFGHRTGQLNENFLNSDLFISTFLGACEPFKANVGVLMFEFAQFHSGDFARGLEFVAALGDFLSKLPRAWRYGVEIRNRSFLRPEYFAMLAQHAVAHVFNSWQNMPPVQEQAALPGSQTNLDFWVARLLLRPGRKYEEAVKRFSPYEHIQDPYPEGRAAAANLIKDTIHGGKKTQAYIYLNNRFEGNALESITAILDEAQSRRTDVKKD